MITSWWFSKKLALGILYLAFKRIRTCWGCKEEWGVSESRLDKRKLREAWKFGKGDFPPDDRRCSHKTHSSPPNSRDSLRVRYCQPPHQLIVPTYISNGKLMGWWVLTRHMVDCLTFEITHIVPRLFLLFSNGHLQHSVLWIIWEKIQRSDKMKYCCLQLCPICTVDVLLTICIIMRTANLTTYFQEKSVSI